MPATPIVCANTAVDLQSAPVNPAWVRSGTPVARNCILSQSPDRSACTLIWDCTPGCFEWHYDTEETIHILEGSIVLDDGVAPARRLGPGDVVFFPAGAVVHWTVETHVRKLAFFRRQLPMPIAVVTRAVSRAKGLARRLTTSRAAAADRPAMAAITGMGDGAIG